MSRLRMLINYDWPVFRLLGFLPPNAWSVLTVAFSAAAGWNYFNGSVLRGALFLACSGLTDLIDGGVARHFGTQSRFGAVFDSVMDRLGEGLIYMGIAGQHLVAVLALILSYGVSYVRAKEDRARSGIAERNDRLTLLFLASILSFLEIGLYIISAGAAVTIVMRLLEVKKLYGSS